jgi:N-acetylglucosaminyldiphosphoundecaprenol N-acetyl-beta-D-mannosaminyltransferase
MSELLRANVLGVGVHALNMPLAIEHVDRAISENKKGYICVTGVHGVMEAQADSEFREILNSAFLNTPDGMPTVWVGHFQGLRAMDRVYGPDFMLEVCKLSQAKGYRHFFYGGKEGVAEALKSELCSRFPGLQVVGTYCPPFRDLNSEEAQNLKELFSKLKPDFTWIGLSTPKQERFMKKYLPILDTKIMVGVGAAFDIHTGSVKEPPHWVKRAGMQWFHRLLQEPKRLWKRYLINNPKFILRILAQFLGLKKYSLTS